VDYILVVAGLVLLFIGGEGLVRGSVVISKRLGISAILIGMIVIGFGTSAPELVVSVQAILGGKPDIAIGNVVGSNIANILLVLGVAALIVAVECKDKVILRDAFAVLAASIFLIVVVTSFAEIPRLAGGFMMLSLIGYLVYGYRAEKVAKMHQVSMNVATVHEREVEEFEDINLGMLTAIFYAVAGLGILLLGADILVEGATNIAKEWGVSEAVIGLSLVAVGTSLPELATVIVASLRKRTDVIIGAIMGSMLFNILSVLGITSLIEPIPVSGRIIEFDMVVMLSVTIVAVLVIWRLKRFGRVTGTFFIGSYVTYVAWLYGAGTM
jgi:cation:H+ antiporter